MTKEIQAIRVVEGTKVSHDYAGTTVTTFPLSELIEKKIPAVGIPCKENRLIVIDIDIPSEQHQYDGRPFWQKFCEESGIPATYTVMTRGGGYHFYFWLPPSVNEHTFAPPKTLALGVDVKWNGWVAAPPSAGYRPVYGTHDDIQLCPPSLMMALLNNTHARSLVSDVQIVDGLAITHHAYTPEQVNELRHKIRWVQTNGTLSRDEWRDGIFSLKAGLHETPEVLEELVTSWTQNGSYQAGDEHEALSIAERATPYGKIGPGTIFSVIQGVMSRVTSPAMSLSHSLDEILGKAQIIPDYDKKGFPKVEPSEANAGAIINALFPFEELHHDIRQDLYIFKGRAASDEDIINQVIPIVQRPLQGLGLFKFKKNILKAGLDVAMSTRRIDPHAEHIKSCVWDGHSRIETFFIDYFGVEDTEYYRTLGKNLWVALAARALRPGCKFDHVIVFEGREGLRKSSAIEAIGGDYTYASSGNDAFINLDSLREMHQAVVVELPELKGIIGVDAETVKAFLSKKYDHIRALWAKKAIKALRSFICIGTTNSKKYLTKGMGIRRFWPVRIPDSLTHIDTNSISLNRDQFYAEAVAMLKDGYTYWHLSPELLNPMIEVAIETNDLDAPVVDAIKHYVAGSKFSTYDVFLELTRKGAINKGYNKANVTRIEDALEGMGCPRDVSGKWVKDFTDENAVENKMINYMEGLV